MKKIRLQTVLLAGVASGVMMLGSEVFAEQSTLTNEADTEMSEKLATLEKLEREMTELKAYLKNKPNQKDQKSKQNKTSRQTEEKILEYVDQPILITNSNLSTSEQKLNKQSREIQAREIQNLQATSTWQSAGILHKLKKGETFYSLAKKYKITSKAIAENNKHLNPRKLVIGDRVRIPVKNKPKFSAKKASIDKLESTYRVKRGDSLSKIGKKLGMDWRKLARINNLQNTHLKIGQRLYLSGNSSRKLPKSTNKHSIPNIPKVNLPKEKNTYKVKSGDTLSKIGRKKGISWRELMEINNLHSPRIEVGQILILSEDKPRIISSSSNANTSASELSYTVKKGDTLYKISDTFKTDIGSIMKINGLNSDMIMPGQKLTIVPGRKLTTNSGKLIRLKKNTSIAENSKRKTQNRSTRTKSPKSSKKSQQIAKNIEYRVKRGDTLKHIAHKFSTSAKEIRQLNSKDGQENIYIDEVLRIPRAGDSKISSQKVEKTKNEKNVLKAKPNGKKILQTKANKKSSHGKIVQGIMPFEKTPVAKTPVAKKPVSNENKESSISLKKGEILEVKEQTLENKLSFKGEKKTQQSKPTQEIKVQKPEVAKLENVPNLHVNIGSGLNEYLRKHDGKKAKYWDETRRDIVKQSVSYVVEEADTMHSIAQKFHTTPNAIRLLNSKSNSYVPKVAERIFIPSQNLAYTRN